MTLSLRRSLLLANGNGNGRWGCRKFYLGVGYLAIGFVLGGASVYKADAALLASVAALMTALATGVGVITWGFVKEYTTDAVAARDTQFHAERLLNDAAQRREDQKG